TSCGSSASSTSDGFGLAGGGSSRLFIASSLPTSLNALHEIVRITELEGARLVEPLHDLGGKRQLARLQVVVELPHVPYTHDDGCHRGLLQQPAQRHRRRRGGELLGRRFDRVEDLPVARRIEAAERILPLVEPRSRRR